MQLHNLVGKTVLVNAIETHKTLAGSTIAAGIYYRVVAGINWIRGNDCLILNETIRNRKDDGGHTPFEDGRVIAVNLREDHEIDRFIYSNDGKLVIFVP